MTSDSEPVLSEAGQELKRIFTTPLIDDAGIDTGYDPWAMWITGANFTPTLKAQLYDTTGTQWASGCSVVFGHNTFVSFQLPANSPPSGCNVNKTCRIQLHLTDKDSQYDEIAVTLPASARRE